MCFAGDGPGVDARGDRRRDAGTERVAVSHVNRELRPSEPQWGKVFSFPNQLTLNLSAVWTALCISSTLYCFDLLLWSSLGPPSAS